MRLLRTNCEHYDADALHTTPGGKILDEHLQILGKNVLKLALNCLESGCRSLQSMFQGRFIAVFNIYITEKFNKLRVLGVRR